MTRWVFTGSRWRRRSPERHADAIRHAAALSACLRSRRAGARRAVAVVHDREDHRRVHRDHGWRGNAHARRAEGLRLDPGPARPQPRGATRIAAAARGWVENIMKEETYPSAANMALFILAPVMSFVPALLTFAVIPFAAPLRTPWGVVNMSIADAPIGFLYILAIASLG